MTGFSPAVVAAAVGPRFPLTDGGVLAALAAAGTTRNQVADFMSTHCYRGQVGCDATCPVALYLIDVFEDCGVSVYREPPDDTVRVEVFGPDGSTVDVAAPEPAAGFVVGFDSGTWPELMRSQPEAVA